MGEIYQGNKPSEILAQVRAASRDGESKDSENLDYWAGYGTTKEDLMRPELMEITSPIDVEWDQSKTCLGTYLIEEQLGRAQYKPPSIRYTRDEPPSVKKRII